jgi:hypothetical protein
MSETILKLDEPVETKTCSKCKEEKPSEAFCKNQGWCKSCHNIYTQNWNKANPEKAKKRYRDYTYRHGAIPMSEAKDSAVYLGVYIAERVLRNCGLFGHIEKMPYGYPGIDFICGKGFGIDLKSACLVKCKRSSNPEWHFPIRHNTVADYFLLLGFRDRKELEPLHIWLVPGYLINNHHNICITNSLTGIEKWKRFEQPLDKVITCCDELKK